MVPPSDDSPNSLGDGATGSDVEPSEPSSPQSLGDQSTTGDMGSSVSDLDALAVNLDDEQHEVVDLATRYELQETLGQGGMGEVLLARDLRLNRQVAIKRLKEELGSSRRAVQRFLTEAQSVAALNHFNIVQIHDYGRATDGPFIVMEYVAGGSLDDRLQDGPLEQATAVELIDQLCQALTATHAQGVIHRDIKPANVLMTAEGVPKLTDFGLARQKTVDGGQTQAGAVLGTLDYMPPEQKVDATQADVRSDLWSLAATFYQMLTGDVPHVIRPDRLPTELTPVLFKALEQDPAVRYQTAEAFREAIHAAEASRPQTTDGGVTIGECSSCGHVSEGDPQYCESCGESLLVPCYSCQSEMKPWVAFCSACGNNIPELLEHRLEELQDQQQQVQTLRGEYRHGEALRLLEEMTAETHPRFAPIREWAQDREPGLRSELQALGERRDAADRAAKAASASHEYGEVIRLLESLPSTVLSESSRQLLADVKQRDERSRELYATIRTSVKEKRKEGLLEQVEEYLALKPGDERVLELRDQLARRQSRQRIEGLATQIRQQRADKQHEGLLPLVKEFLELRPDDERMQRLVETLRTREEDVRREIVTAARQRKRLLRVGVGSGAAVLLLIVIGVAWTVSTTTPPLAVAPFDAEKARQHQKYWADHLGVPIESTNSIGMKFMVIPPGEFMMGSPESDPDKTSIEKLHRVVLSQPFQIGLHEVTQQQYQMVMGKNPSKHRGVNNPVDSVTWMDAVEFCRRLSELPREKAARRVYRLPTEAEWEYACRAGTSGPWCCADVELLESFAWVASNSQTTSHPVGQLAPNAWGLRDVHGNVVEHCADWFGEDFYDDSPGVDPTGPASGERRALRGGAWDAIPKDCRSADRDGKPTIERVGFRVVRIDSNPQPAATTTVPSAGKTPLTLKGHSGLVMSVSFSPDGKRVVSGGYDKTVKIWDISSLATSK